MTKKTRQELEEEQLASRDASAQKLGMKLVKRLRKETGLKGINYKECNWARRVEVPLPGHGWIEIVIDDYSASGYLSYTNKNHPQRVRMNAGYNSNLSGTYKLKDGDLSDAQLDRIAERVKAHVEKRSRRVQREIEEARTEKEMTAKVIDLVTSSGDYKLEKRSHFSSPTFKCSSAKKFELRDEHFGKRIEDHRIDAVSRLVIDFDISVTVSHSSNDTVKVESHRTSFWCPVDNVLEAVDLICAFEWGLHVLTKGE